MERQATHSDDATTVGVARSFGALRASGGHLPAIFVLAMLVMTACGPVGSGEIITETRDIGEFDRIEISDGIVLDVTVDAAAGTVVESVYDNNLQERILTEVDGDTLVIRGSGLGSFDVLGSGRMIEVTIPSLSGLVISGGSRVIGSGAIETLILEADGGATTDLSGLIVHTMHVDVSGGARATVNVTDTIDGEVSGGAILGVQGEPGSRDLDVNSGARVE